jgi:Fibronectin type III domain
MNALKFSRIIAVSAVAVLCPRLSQAASVVLQWDASATESVTGYVLVYGTASQSYTQQVDVGYTTSYTLNDLLDGTTYYLAVRAYDAVGALSAPSAEVTANPLSGSAPVVNSLTLSSNIPSPQPVGAVVNWLSTAAGGVAPYEFQWSLYKAGAWNSWPWASSSTWTWTPSSAGSDYQIRVAVRSSGSSSTTGELTQSTPFTVTAPFVSAATLISNLPAPQLVGTTVLWSAGGTGGVTPYQYKWWVYDGVTWTATTDWTTSSTWSWTPPTANSSYSVRVWVRSAGSMVDAPEASSSIAFAIKPTRLRNCQGPKCK